MKIIVLVGITIATTFVGYVFSLKLKNRKTLFSDLLNFSNHLQLQINYSNTNIIETISQQKNEYSYHFKNMLAEFEKCLLEKKAISIGGTESIITNEEKNIIYEFFNSLGKFDADNQIKSLENQKIIFVDLEKKAREKCDKYCSMFIKLGVITGLALSLLIL